LWRFPILGGLAFFAARTDNYASGSGDLFFDEVKVNLGDCFKDNTTFAPGQDGVYFLSFSAGIPAYTPADFSIVPVDTPSSVYRESTIQEDADMMYRGFLAQMDAADEVTFSSTEDLRSTKGLLTSFTGFSLTDVFTDVHAFYVSRESNYDIQERIEMESFWENIGSNYNVSGREFVAPRAGVYYFFFGSGQPTGVDNRVAIRSWEGTIPETEAELWVHSTSHTGVDMVTRGTMMEMYEG
jgi:hypothetical protein